MNPHEKYGADFFCQAHAGKRADNGNEYKYHDIVVCITPKQDPVVTLAYAWEVLHEIAKWTCVEFKDYPESETYRIIIAWSKTVRENQGQIFKLWWNLDKIRALAECTTPENCSLRFSSDYLPFPNWQKDVFVNRPNQSLE